MRAAVAVVALRNVVVVALVRLEVGMVDIAGTAVMVQQTLVAVVVAVVLLMLPLTVVVAAVAV